METPDRLDLETPQELLRNTPENGEINEAETARVRMADELLKQGKFHRKIIFGSVCGICVLLYIVFFIALYNIAFDTSALDLIVNHKHLMAILLALLIVPSAMLWGLTRAVFQLNVSKDGPADVVHEGIRLYPFSRL